MSDQAVPEEINILALPEREPSNEFRGDAMRGIAAALARLRPARIKLDDLATNVQAFTRQMEKVLLETPAKLGDFEFAEFEVSAALSAKGGLSICGLAGAEAGAQGGLKFVFKRRTHA